VAVSGLVALLALALVILSNVARLRLVVRRLAQAPEFPGREAHR
jgi:hypothetical protein